MKNIYVSLRNNDRFWELLGFILYLTIPIGFIFAMSWIEYLSIALGIISVGLGIVSIQLGKLSHSLASKSDRQMKALTYLEYDEKLAMMATYKQNNSNDEKMLCDLRAVLNLREYADVSRNKQLVDNIILLLKTATLKKNPDAIEIVNTAKEIGLSLKDLEKLEKYLQS